MRNSCFISLVIFLTINAIADSNLNKLIGAEWKGSCRKITNESSKVVKAFGYRRLQSAYSFNGDYLTWSVKAYKDKKCTELCEVNKYVLSCKSKAEGDFSNCIEIKWEYSKDGTNWQSKALLDHSGHANILEMNVAAKLINSKKIELTTIGESEEPSKEILTK